MAGEMISQFLHCRKCVEEWKAGVPEAQGQSPASYARQSAGFTPKGLQIICLRHDLNIVHIDFQGQQHPADTSPDGNFGELIAKTLN